MSYALLLSDLDQILSIFWDTSTSEQHLCLQRFSTGSIPKLFWVVHFSKGQRKRQDLLFLPFSF